MKVNFVNFLKIGSYDFFKLVTMKGDINTYLMVKVLCRLMHGVPLFCPFLGPNLPKNWHFVNFLKNGTYDFFWTPVREGPIRSLLYVCMYVCVYVTKILRFFLNLAQWKGTSIPIEWWRSHVDWCMGYPFICPFLGPNLPKNQHFVNFLENSSCNFF